MGKLGIVKGFVRNHIIRNYTPQERLRLNALRLVSRSARTLLDIGPGIKPFSGIRSKIHILAEPCKEYVHELQKLSDRKYLILNAKAEEVLEILPSNSIEVIVLIDVIEHMTKDAGKKVIGLSTKVTSKNVIVFTPLGFVEQEHSDGKDAWGLNGGIWQQHVSGWTPEEFNGTGWKCFSMEKYHLYDTHGKLRDEPAGAFYAVYTKTDKHKRG